MCICTTRSQLLYVGRRVPWPLHGGAAIRNYWTLAALSRKYAVDVLATAADRYSHLDMRIDLRSVEVFPEASRRVVLHRLVDGLRAGIPYFLAGQVPGEMRAAVSHLLATRRYDALVVAELAAGQALPAEPGVPVIYDAHNCECELLRRRAATEGIVLRPFLLAEAARVRRVERDMLRRAALVTATSGEDVDDLARILPAARERMVVIPNGVDAISYRECSDRPPKSGTLLVPGSINWRPNFLGLLWFLRKVCPILLSRHPGIEIRVAGRMTAAQASELERFPAVCAIRNPDDMRPELARAQAVLVPVLASSGTRLRITEAWASGRPVVTTRAGALGMDASLAGRAFLVADSPEEFADAVHSLLEDPSLGQGLCSAGLQQAQAFDWGPIGGTLLEAYARVLAGRPFCGPSGGIP